ncbi:hypothetical protein BCR34DRAFT_575926, partial [Clohesyomyces aquaticus]
MPRHAILLPPLGVVGLSRSTVIAYCYRKVPSSILGAEIKSTVVFWPFFAAWRLFCALSFWGRAHWLTDSSGWKFGLGLWGRSVGSVRVPIRLASLVT